MYPRFEGRSDPGGYICLRASGNAPGVKPRESAEHSAIRQVLAESGLAKSSAAWILEIWKPVPVGPWVVMVSARLESPCGRMVPRGSNVGMGAEDMESRS